MKSGWGPAIPVTWEVVRSEHAHLPRLPHTGEGEGQAKAAAKSLDTELAPEIRA